MARSEARTRGQDIAARFFEALPDGWREDMRELAQAHLALLIDTPVPRRRRRTKESEEKEVQS